MLRHLFLTAVATALAAAPSALSAPAHGAAPLPLPVPLSQPQPEQPEQLKQDNFIVTVTNPESTRAKGTYELKCGPAGGTHPKPQAACDRLVELGRSAGDPFANVPAGASCTMLYGGPATARVTGVWKGRSVDATFNRKNGCEIARWKNLEPVLPSLQS
jgi:hypothetical protein